MSSPPLKPVHWMGSSRRDLRQAPGSVRDGVGYALEQVQRGKKPRNAKPLKCFSGAGVLEIVEDSDRDTWRAVYTVEVADAVYVLHVFQKKSKTGIATPKPEIDLVRRRLRDAIADGKARPS